MEGNKIAPWGIRWLLVPVILYYLVNTAVVFIGTQFMESQAGMWKMESGNFAIYWKTVVRMAGMFLGGAAVYPFYRKMNCKTFELKRSFEKKEMLEIAAAGAILGAGLNLLFFLLGFTESSETYTKVSESQFSVPLWLAVIFYGILSPVVEEMVFRGILYRALKANIGVIGAAMGSALAFGVFHGNIVQAVYGSIMGICLAFHYEKYGKIAAPVLFHSAANVVVYLLSSL